ncbi:MAG: cation:proton antiporter [Candidatus Aenigmatarchaeota archaeon]|nr:MAG: cation:proton antiporter [Candidatus Aenigmarchaeota archaeon]
MSSVFFDIGLVVVASALVALLAHALRQPPIIAYIIAGLLVGPVLGFVKPSGTLEAFSAIGVAFLLYLIGLNLKPRVLREVGSISFVTGLGQVLFTSLIGYFIVRAMGFEMVEALYISAALTFSSTVIVVKVLSDKGDLDALYGKVSVGLLLVQDFVSIVVLILITGFASGVPLPVLVGLTAGKTLLFLALVYLSSRYFLPPVMGYIARSQELLFLAGIAWMFLFAGIAAAAELSIEAGAFLAGVSMASLPYTYDLGSRIRPLRDFFVVLFFIALGTQMTPALIGTILYPALALSLFVLVGNPLIVMVLMGALGYTKRTGFMTGLTIAQISEFSLILMALGLAFGHVTQTAVTLVTLVGAVTIAGSVYMMAHGERLFRLLAPYLGVFERKNIKELKPNMRKYRADTILIGCDRMGRVFLSHMKTAKKKLSVIDFNPAVVKELRAKGYNCLYGDATDAYVQEGLLRLKPKLVVSTMPGFDDSASVIDGFKKTGSIIFVTAGTVKDAQELYGMGADYVVMPHFLGSETAAKMVSEFTLGRGKDIITMRKHHVRHLKDRYRKGAWV